MGRQGIRDSPEYRSWEAMKSRCYRIKDKDYHRYGGKGIKVCERWLHDFETFLADMGPISETVYQTLDRKDGTKDYTPENCKWSDIYEQNANRSNSVLLTINNETKTARQWAKIRNINYVTLLGRVKRGWATERALEINR